MGFLVDRDVQCMGGLGTNRDTFFRKGTFQGRPPPHPSTTCPDVLGRLNSASPQRNRAPQPCEWRGALEQDPFGAARDTGARPSVDLLRSFSVEGKLLSCLVIGGWVAVALVVKCDINKQLYSALQVLYSSQCAEC